jgi:hypothetical protein
LNEFLDLVRITSLDPETSGRQATTKGAMHLNHQWQETKDCHHQRVYGTGERERDPVCVSFMINNNNSKL